MNYNAEICRISYSNKLYEKQFKKVDLVNSVWKYDVIHYALKVICDENLNAHAIPYKVEHLFLVNADDYRSACSCQIRSVKYSVLILKIAY